MTTINAKLSFSFLCNAVSLLFFLSFSWLWDLNLIIIRLNVPSDTDGREAALPLSSKTNRKNFKLLRCLLWKRRPACMVLRFLDGCLHDGAASISLTGDDRCYMYLRALFRPFIPLPCCWEDAVQWMQTVGAGQNFNNLRNGASATGNLIDRASTHIRYNTR